MTSPCKRPAVLLAPRAAATRASCSISCNYEARRRGLHKLQLVKEAKRLCPDLVPSPVLQRGPSISLTRVSQVIVLGEDLTRFRNASKDLHRFLRQFSWNGRVWLDVTDQVDYNVSLLNANYLANAYFCLSKDDPTHGFAFDATQFAGNTYPASGELSSAANHDSLRLRLLLGSHLARHLRAELQNQKGYTATVGISTNKLLSKLAGNVQKPNGQTTLLPPYDTNATNFIDDHDIGKIPGIGFKLAQKLRGFVLQRAAAFSDGLLYGGTQEQVTAGDVGSAS
ncbi:putative dna polymerase [Diplodia seriata]|uniref:Putative dna polymerase n=1 Tax=Diplodia seriata TaxID=420778 RepID=A0A0G2E2F2_9PEZI|nr:putative dna polymerase [Diplodia seriata]